MPSRRVTVFLALALVSAAALGANDGVDRYRKATPNSFRLFSDPVSPRSGYGVLDRDMEGGADGELRFRWAQAHAVALVKVAAAATARDLGPAPHPLLVFDASAENGDTPVDLDPRPRGRHPGGSHDGGLNLDLGYYLTSLQGKVYTPDFAAGTEHFETGPDGKPKDVPILLGPADRLDAPRTARFTVELFRIHLSEFQGDLLEEVGMDFEVRKLVLEQARAWATKGQFGADATLVEEMERVLTSDVWNGWARTHHHHLHLRVRDLPPMGRHRPALDRLLARQRGDETELLRAARGQEGPCLRLELESTDLERAVEAELLPTGLVVEGLRFRLDGGEWRKAQPGDPRNRAVLEVPAGFHAEPRKARVEAEFVDARGRRQVLQAEQVLPPLDPRLQVAVEASRLGGAVSRDGDSLRVKASLPQPSLALVTEVALLVRREGREPEKVVLADPAQEAMLPDAASVRQVDLRVLCSGRRPLRTLLYLAR